MFCRGDVDGAGCDAVMMTTVVAIDLVRCGAVRCGAVLSQAREEAIARGEDPDAAEALILNGGQAPVAVVKEPEPPQPQTTGLEGGGLGIDADVRTIARLDKSIYGTNVPPLRTVLL